MARFSVYMIANASRQHITVGITNNLTRQMSSYRAAMAQFTTAAEPGHALVYYEQTDDIMAALKRERVLRRLPLAQQQAIIDRVNPRWLDLTRHLPQVRSFANAVLWQGSRA